MYYGYRHLRKTVRQTYPAYPELDTPESTSDSVSLAYLQRIRCESDFEESTGYAYRKIGNDAMVDSWIDFGIQQGLLGGFWRCELERLVGMERSAANKMLMGQLHFDQL